MYDTDRYAAILPANIDSDAEVLTEQERENAAELSVSELTSLDWDGVGDMLNGSDPEIVSHDNTRMAGFALHALEAYADVTGALASAPAEQVIRDLLGDLYHLADALGVRFEGLVERGVERAREEATGRA